VLLHRAAAASHSLAAVTADTAAASLLLLSVCLSVPLRDARTASASGSASGRAPPRRLGGGRDAQMASV
jgi:hypothetical protein